MVWEPFQTPTAAQVSTHKNQSCGSVGEQHVSEIHYQFWGTHVVLKDLREREEKKTDLVKKSQNYCLHTYVETKRNPLQALVLLRQKLIIHCWKQTFPSGLSPAVQILLGAHILDISSQDRKYFFSSIWIKKSLDTLNQGYTLRFFSMK